MITLLIRGFGLGAVIIPLMTGAYQDLVHHEMPDASIITRVSQQLGGSFGVAVLAAILTHAAIGATDLNSLAGAFDIAFWWATGFSAAAVGASLLLPDTHTNRSHRQAPPHPLHSRVDLAE